MTTDDYYGGDMPAPAPETGPHEAPKESEGEGEDYPSVLIPKDFCKDKMEVGDVFQARVEQVLEDQYSVKYEPEGEGETEKEEPEKGSAPMPKPPGGGMASLYE